MDERAAGGRWGAGVLFAYAAQVEGIGGAR